MRNLLAFVLMLALVGSAAAADLSNQSSVIKGDSHVLMNQAWDRDGGEDMATAVPFTAIPFYDTGATCDNVHDYDFACPYTGSTAPDVVYTFTPAADILITVDLDGSGYDTKVYVADAEGNVVGCNDDSHLPGYVSYLENVALVGGVQYFIIVDGYGTDCGAFVMNVTEFIPAPPCFIACDGEPEGEFPLNDGYMDRYNPGCNADTPKFQDLQSSLEDGTLDFCGVAGWYLSSEGAEYRDLDWFTVTFGASGQIDLVIDAQSPTICFEVVLPCGEEMGLPQNVIAGPCMPASMTVYGAENSVGVFAIGSTVFNQSDAGYAYGNEYNYSLNFTGLLPGGTVAVESSTWDSVKSMYR